MTPLSWASVSAVALTDAQLKGVISTHTRFTASNLEEVANPLCAQANSASYPQRDGK